MSDAEANRVLPNRLRLYIALIAVAGAGWLAYLVQDAQWGLSSLGEMGLIVGAGSFPLHVSPRLKADVTTAVLFCGALVLEPGVAALAGVLGIVCYNLLNGHWGERLKLPWYKYPFNAGETALFVGVTSVVFGALTTGEGVLTAAVVPAAAVMYLSNTLLVSGAVGLQVGVNPLRVWWSGTMENGPAELGQLAFGFLGAVAYRESPWTIVALFIPVAVIYLAFSRLARANARVIQTTEELTEANGTLKAEIEERQQKELELRQSEERRERLLQDVSANHEMLRSLSRRLVEVQEEERRHLARELHDEIGQVLTGLKLSLEAGALSVSPVAVNGVGQARELIDGLIERVREMSLDLRPAMLDDHGLVPTLLWYFDRYTSQTRVHVSFEHGGLEERFPPDVETAAYRIVQEALTNVARHARVKHASVGMHRNRDALEVSVVDNGVGFDTNVMVALEQSVGLSGMWERAGLLGGELTIQAASGQGTRLVCRLPLGRDANGSKKKLVSAFLPMNGEPTRLEPAGTSAGTRLDRRAVR